MRRHRSVPYLCKDFSERNDAFGPLRSDLPAVCCALDAAETFELAQGVAEAFVLHGEFLSKAGAGDGLVEFSEFGEDALGQGGRLIVVGLDET